MMKRLFLLIALVITAINANAQHLIDKEGNIYIEKHINITDDFDTIVSSTVEMFEQNSLYGGKVLSQSSNKLTAQYVFKGVATPFPLTIDAVAYVSISKKNNVLAICITLKDYNKRNSSGGLWVSPIKDTKPLNPKGSKFGLTNSQLKKLLDKTISEGNSLSNKIEANVI